MSVKTNKANVEIVMANLEQAVKDLAAVLGVPEKAVYVDYKIHPFDYAPKPDLLLAMMAVGGKMDNNEGSHWVKATAGRGSLIVFFTDDDQK